MHDDWQWVLQLMDHGYAATATLSLETLF